MKPFKEKLIECPLTLESTDQEIFDWVASQLLRQGRRAVNAYLNPSLIDHEDPNCRCAIGWTIPLRLMGSLPFLNTAADLEWSHFQQVHGHLLKPLMYIHDIDDPSKWETRLRAFAESKQLEWNVS